MKKSQVKLLNIFWDFQHSLSWSWRTKLPTLFWRIEHSRCCEDNSNISDNNENQRSRIQILLTLYKTLVLNKLQFVPVSYFIQVSYCLLAKHQMLPIIYSENLNWFQLRYLIKKMILKNNSTTLCLNNTNPVLATLNVKLLTLFYFIV